MSRVVLGATVLLACQPAFATFHLWQIVKVYSNASGTVQYVELFTTASGQEFVSGHAITSNTHSFTLPTDLPATLTHTTANQHLLLATPGYFALSGVPPADYNLGVNNFFSIGADTLNWAGVNSLSFSAGQLPTDGVSQIERSYNTTVLMIDVNSPTDFAGTSGTITSHPPFFAGEVFVGSGTYSLQFPNGNLFGYYGYLPNGWIYHFDMGYAYVAPGNGPEVYLWDLSTGHWWYTNNGTFPYLYDFTLNAWIYYFPDTHNAGHYTTSPRYYVNMTTGQIFTM